MVNAPVEQQERLLKVQEADLAIQRAERTLRSLPEDIALAANAEAIENAQRTVVLTRAEVSDAQRAVAKTDDEVQAVRARAARDEERVASAGVSAKDVQALQSELEVLARRQSELEDVELDAMERLEAAQSAADAAVVELEKLKEERENLERAREAAAQIAEESIVAARLDREAFGAGLDPALVKLYERIRDAQGGVGAAALVGTTCQGCHMALGPGDMSAIRSASPETVVRCEECGRILVRTGA